MKKSIIIFLLVLPFISMAQLHVNAGGVDIQDRGDGYTVSSQLGYDHFFNGIGVGVNYRNASMRGDIYYTLEINSKYRVVDNNRHRLDFGAGAGYNLDDYDIHPILYSRGSVRLTQNLWFDVIFDNAYRNSKDLVKPGWRWETYFMFGFSMDFL